MIKHIHAAQMAQYAEDAKFTDKPWTRWVVDRHTGLGWQRLHGHPQWAETARYQRRLPETEQDDRECLRAAFDKAFAGLQAVIGEAQKECAAIFDKAKRDWK